MRNSIVVLLLCAILQGASGCCADVQVTTSSRFELDLLRLGEEVRLEAGLDILSSSEARRRIEQLAGRIAGERLEIEAGAPALLAQRVLSIARLSRDIEDDRPELALPAGVLSRRRGSCLGLAGLYLAVALRLGWSAGLVLVPDHAFVRVDIGGKHENVELLRGGEAMEDRWYEEKYRPPDGNSTYMRVLNTREALSVFRYNAASAFGDKGQFDRAYAEYLRVLSFLPDYAEAHAAAGLVLHRQGRTDEAREHYQAALRASRAIEGVRQNLERLEKSRQ